MQIAEPTNLATPFTEAARDFALGIISSKRGYNIFTGNTVGIESKHISAVISRGLRISSTATKPIKDAKIVIKTIDILKHF